ncbi:hypothetical protein D3C85_1214970 [compost metagenome]
MDTTIFSSLLPSTTIGLPDKVWGYIGTITMASSLGCMIGPPADSAYAVEPVGVATIRPSAFWLQTNWPSICSSNSIIRVDLPGCSTTSFSASPWPIASPWRRTSASSRKRLSTLYWPSSTSATFTSSSSGRISVRKPRLPRLIPSTGVLCRASARAAPSILPSPPTTITRSQTSPRILREEVCRPWPGNTSAMVSSRITWR